MSDKPKDCKAVRVSDEWQCHKCGLYWDSREEGPGACKAKRKKSNP